MNTFVKTTMILFLSFARLWPADAQTRYESAMTATLQALADARQPAVFEVIARQFEEIGDTNADRWTPLYYAAYCYLVAGMSQQIPQEKDTFYEKAINRIENAESRAPENSEIHALKGYVQYMQMSVDPQNRLNLIGIAEASLQKATQLDPSNPRPYFIKGQNTFYTPEPFGGGSKAAKPQLELAKEKFDAFKPTEKFAPDWGDEQCTYLLQQVNPRQ